MGDIRDAWFLWGDLMERGHLENLGINGKIMLEWAFKK
jgi:hypothetical protein